MKKKPTLHLMPAVKDGPTPEHILQLFERVTGRRRTAEGVKAVTDEFTKAGLGRLLKIHES